jgi:hypothetical protein
LTITDLTDSTTDSEIKEVEPADDPSVIAKDEAVKRELEEKERELDEQIKVFEPIALVVEREITHPDGTKKVFVQKEFSFMTKIRFLRLLSGTVRLAAEAGGTTVAGVIQDTFGDMQAIINEGFDEDSTEDVMANQFISTVIRLVELAPDFLEELFLIALEVPKKESEIKWALEAFETLDDDEGFSILDTIVAQNSKAIKDFFTERITNTAKRGRQELEMDLKITD